MLRAAAYLPTRTDGRRRVRSWDEDAFTLVATALERLLAGSTSRPPAWTIREVGAARALPPELLAGILGESVTVVPAPDPTASPLADALERASHGAGPELLVGAVEEASGSPASAVPPPGEGAFALLVDELPSSTASLLPAGTAPLPGQELAALVPIAQRADAAAAKAWVGDWAASPAVGRPPPPQGPPAFPSAAVSEGAYVPRASYLEAVASRWRFSGERCRSCSTLSFPSRGRCRRCGRADTLTAESLPRDGLEVVALTWIGPGGQPTEFDEQVAAVGPYGVALVALADGLRATVALTDTEPGEIRLGGRVDTRLRRLYAIEGSWRYGRKAVVRQPTPG